MNDTRPNGYKGFSVAYETCTGDWQIDGCADLDDGRRIADGAGQWYIEDENGEIVEQS